MTPIPTQVTFRGLAHSDALESDILERVSRLEQFYAGIMKCRVLVEIPHRHHREGRPFHARIELTVPGGTLIAESREPSLHARLRSAGEDAHHKDTEIGNVHRDAYVAVHDAFDTARRRLEDFAREQRGAVKTHEAPAEAAVVEVSPVERAERTGP